MDLLRDTYLKVEQKKKKSLEFLCKFLSLTYYFLIPSIHACWVFERSLAQASFSINYLKEKKIYSFFWLSNVAHGPNAAHGPTVANYD